MGGGDMYDDNLCEAKSRQPMTCPNVVSPHKKLIPLLPIKTAANFDQPTKCRPFPAKQTHAKSQGKKYRQEAEKRGF